MLLIRPETVTFGGVEIAGVTRVVVDREASALALEWDDSGPHARFCDVPRQRARVRMMVALTRETMMGPGLGTTGELRIETAANASDVGRSRVRIVQAVVTGVRHEVSREGKSAAREIELEAVSANGNDPIEVTVLGVA